jgi:hypothetical protein
MVAAGFDTGSFVRLGFDVVCINDCEVGGSPAGMNCYDLRPVGVVVLNHHQKLRALKVLM